MKNKEIAEKIYAQIAQAMQAVRFSFKCGGKKKKAQIAKLENMFMRSIKLVNIYDNYCKERGLLDDVLEFEKGIDAELKIIIGEQIGAVE